MFKRSKCQFKYNGLLYGLMNGLILESVYTKHKQPKSTQENKMMDGMEMEMDSGSIQNIMTTVRYWKPPRSGELFESAFN